MVMKQFTLPITAAALAAISISIVSSNSQATISSKGSVLQSSATIAQLNSSVKNSVSSSSSQEINGFCNNQLNGTLFARAELFFGLSKSDGSMITETEFQNFVDTEVTPRFPDGLTLLNGTGQFRTTSGNIIKEGSKLLILLYPYSPDSSIAIEQIREAYKTTFQQQSVLRVDDPSCVSF
jgi:hypothetical protein